MQRLMIVLVVSMLLPVRAAMADDALVLPRGVWRVSADARFSFPITKRFTPDGGTEDLAADFNRDLNSTFVPDLRLVEAAFRLPEGSATFGRSVVDFEQHIQLYTVQAAYGLTDRLSLGVRIPYWTQHIKVQAALDTRTATVGFNPAVPGGVAPLGVAGTRPADDRGYPGPCPAPGVSTRGRLVGCQCSVIASAGSSINTIGRRTGVSPSRAACVSRPAAGTIPITSWTIPPGIDAWGLGIQLHQDFVWHMPGRTRRSVAC